MEVKPLLEAKGTKAVLTIKDAISRPRMLSPSLRQLIPSPRQLILKVTLPKPMCSFMRLFFFLILYSFFFFFLFLYLSFCCGSLPLCIMTPLLFNENISIFALWIFIFLAIFIYGWCNYHFALWWDLRLMMPLRVNTKTLTKANNNELLLIQMN